MVELRSCTVGWRSGKSRKQARNRNLVELGRGNLENRDHRVDLIGSVNLALTS